jgi:hypothetical protein
MPQHFGEGNFDPEFVDALVDIFEETCALWLSRSGKPLSKAARSGLRENHIGKCRGRDGPGND